MNESTIASQGIVSSARRGKFIPVVFAPQKPPSRARTVINTVIVAVLGLSILTVPVITTIYTYYVITESDSVVNMQTQVIPSDQATRH